MSEPQITAILLILGFFVFLVGGMMFTYRAILKRPFAQSSVYLYWERGFVMAAALVSTLSLVMLENLLRAAGDTYLARLAVVLYLVGTVIGLVAETAYVSKRDWFYAQIVTYVVLAFLAQAAFGVALLQTGLVAGWIGWATILWNLIWLAVLSIASPRDIYFPVLHHVAPLVIGIALLTTAS